MKINVKTYYVHKKKVSNWAFNHFYYKKVYSILLRNVKVVLPLQIEIFLFLLRFDWVAVALIQTLKIDKFVAPFSNFSYLQMKDFVLKEGCF